MVAESDVVAAVVEQAVIAGLETFLLKPDFGSSLLLLQPSSFDV